MAVENENFTNNNEKKFFFLFMYTFLKTSKLISLLLGLLYLKYNVKFWCSLVI